MTPSLIDTDILSYYFKNNPLVIRRANNYLKEHSFFSYHFFHNLFEILSGLSYREASRQIEYFEAFIQDCEVLNITEVSIRHSAKRVR